MEAEGPRVPYARRRGSAEMRKGLAREAEGPPRVPHEQQRVVAAGHAGPGQGAPAGAWRRSPAHRPSWPGSSVRWARYRPATRTTGTRGAGRDRRSGLRGSASFRNRSSSDYIAHNATQWVAHRIILSRCVASRSVRPHQKYFLQPFYVYLARQPNCLPLGRHLMTAGTGLPEGLERAAVAAHQ
jgi:hypothetical protein